jgi:glyoxylate reductase
VTERKRVRVLVAGEAAAFLEDVEVPPDVEVDILAAGAPVPEGDYAGILPVLTRRIGASELDRLPALRVVANMAVGYDNVDVAAARARGVRVTNTPDVLTGATAELTWALILATARRVGEGERRVREGTWTGWEPTQLLGTALDGKVLGIVGAGRIGREVGRRAGAFGMGVAYWGRSRSRDWERETGAEWIPSLPALAAHADVLSIHLASNAGTRDLVDGALLDRMKPGAMLVNTARGDVIDEAALVARLERGRIRAGLDVYAHEPEVPARLRALDNVVLLPHLGSATRETRQAMFDLAWDNLLRCVRGDAPLTPVE